MVATTRLEPLNAADAELFAAARLRAARSQPYLATALFAMVPVVRPGFGTFAVDRYWRVYLDMDQAREWGVAATAAVLVHEAHHLVRGHHERARRVGATGERHRDWNLAADAAINDDLVDDGLDLPDPVLPHHLGCRRGGFEEVYYRALRDPHHHRPERPRRPVVDLSDDPDDPDGDDCDADDPEPDPGCGSGSGGSALPVEIDDEPADPTEGLDDVDADAVRRAVAHDIASAHAAGGTVPPGLHRWATALLTPQVPWRTLLRSAVRRDLRATTRHTEPDWSRPDRRAASTPGVLRPGQRRLRSSVAVVIDTSASMNSPRLDAAVTELDALLHHGGVAPVPVVVCDELAARTQTVRRLSELCLSGGRGTDLRVGIAAAAALRPLPRLIVVLTDGWTPWPDTAPPRTSVLAVIIDESEHRVAPAPSSDGFRTVRVDTP